MRINSLVESALMAQEVFDLPADESHHLARVLRVQPGQELVVFDGAGRVAEAEVLSVHKSAVSVRVTSRHEVPPPPVQVDLIQALPKPDRWDWVLQKAVELGVSNIYPVVSQHTAFHVNDKKHARWEKIVLNAAQQCEVRWLPTLHRWGNMASVERLLGGYDAAFIGSLYEGAKPFRQVEKGGLKRVALLIGPEGDFSAQEVACCVKAGATPVSFGSRILRTETAALFGLSVLAYELLSD